MKTAVVTGANRGIGLEIVKQLSGLNFQVFAIGRELSRLEGALHALGEFVIPVVADVCDRQACEDAATVISRKSDVVDVLINNAGIMGYSRAPAFDIPEWHRVLHTNLMGAINMCSALWPLLLYSMDGRVINMSSSMGILKAMNQGDHSPYRLSKWALNGWTMQLAAEAPAHIRVNAMCPGWVRTDMGGSSAPRSPQQGAETAIWLATESQIPHGKFLRDKTVLSW